MTTAIMTKRRGTGGGGYTPPTENLWGWWPLASNATDSSGNGRNLANNGVTFTGSWGNFDTSDSLALSEVVSTYPFTIIAHIQTTANTFGAIAAFQQDSVTNNYHGLITASGDVYGRAMSNVGGTAPAISTTSVQTGSRLCIAGVWTSATSRKIYINGTYEAQNTTSKLYNASIDIFKIGLVGTGGYFIGGIDNVLVYTAALDQPTLAAICAGFA